MTRTANEGISRKAAYGERLRRLISLNDRYDPTSFFRLNANIPTSRGGRP